MAEPEDALPRMTLSEHLDELRRRLVWSAIALGAAMLLSFFFYDPLWAFTVKPYDDALLAAGASPTKLQAIAPGEGFLQILRLCFLVGLVAAGPFVIWQMWGFIAAGLYAHEKKAVRTFFPISLLLFALGMLAAYLLLIPFGLRFLIGFDSSMGDVKYSVAAYLDICVKMVLAMGFLFELPLVMLFCQAVGLVERATWIKGWRLAVVFAFVVGMLLTDPSPITQIMMAVPVIGLYFLGIWGGRFVGEKAERFTIWKAWPLLVAAAAYTLLIVERDRINDWSSRVFGGEAKEAPAEPGEPKPAEGAKDR
ncbi:MAG: twin-arginine translocase subunit TatC [Planctomycetota bacterium]